MPDLVLDYHRLKKPIDHPDASVTASKLDILDYVVLKGLTADPPLRAGILWFRSDLKQLRWSPDGTSVYIVDPVLAVSKSWNDTTGHYFNTNTAYTAWAALPAIQLNNPATGHKRSFEDLQTGYLYVHGWFIDQNAILGTKIEINASVGAYHGYDNTRANLNFVFGDPRNYDKKTYPGYPYVRLHWTMSSLGYANGAYGKPLSGYILLTSPPSYSFSPANPSVSYSSITSLPNSLVHILYGYEDRWSADYNQWASLQDITYYRKAVATEITYKVLDEFQAYGRAVRLIEMDGEVRLWVTKGDSCLVIPLAKSGASVRRVRAGVKTKLGRYEAIAFSERERGKDVELTHTIMVKDRGKTVLAHITYDSSADMLHIIHGEDWWDGDKYGFHIEVF